MLHHALAQPALADLKRKSVVGGVAALSAQGFKFVVQTTTTMVLARLLSPEDFGLHGMVVTVTGFVTLLTSLLTQRNGSFLMKLAVTHGGRAPWLHLHD
jgi:Polysaccharide biosynthesis protein